MIRFVTSFLLFAVFATSPLAGYAAPITVPSGLSAGDQYRLAFVTSTRRDATSSDIADYNAFVTTAASTVSELVALGTTWSAIASTEDVDARDNTATNPSLAPGLPIYLLNDSRLAANNGILWSNASGLLETRLNITESGDLSSASTTWTGTSPDGTASRRPLGLPGSISGTTGAPLLLITSGSSA